ncbi:MAG: DUF3182 domain-containing protein [Comamonadaceae bacterium]|nr:DUF3182 domain-containing protein [Comamonadaceae bacterium]
MTDNKSLSDRPGRPPARPGKQPVRVFFHHVESGPAPSSHETGSKAQLAQALAGLLGGDYAGELDTQRPCKGGLYLVPSETLPDLASARRLGVHTADDLFGGVVPFPFVATKVISHPLLNRNASAPAGWSAGFAEQVLSAVLPGYSVFSADDVRRACAQLLSQGSVRLKDPGGVGGVGQWVVGTGAELEALLREIASEGLWRRGLVLERNLQQVLTHSVGQVQVGEWLASYHGVQHTTRNHAGTSVYGGSELMVVRGGFDSLMQLPLESATRLAVEQALTYHAAALSAFGGMFMSRSNYDVAQGLDESGQWRSGVLEQSWRIGGASGAEIAALRAFAADPRLQRVRSSTYEEYGNSANVPAGAWVLFDGIDDQIGRITKYALTTDHVHA